MKAAMAVDTAGLPAAFRETALTVTMLGWEATPPTFAALRERCQAQVRRLRAEWTAAGHAEDVIDDAVYAQCAWLDEAALRHLRDGDRDAWEHTPMQVTEFGTHDAGEVLIARMQQRLQQTPPVRPLLAMFHAVLALGFHGRLALAGADARTAMLQALEERLGEATGAADGVVVRSSPRWRWRARLSLPMWTMLAIGAACVTWVLLDHWLAAAAAQLLR
jgi:type VI secretion system protein ImpK